MCLAVPGRIESIREGGLLDRVGRVSFGGSIRDVNLAFVPEACVGHYVIVHVGFALSVVDEDEARRTLEDIRLIESGPAQTDDTRPRPL
ncbi:MAG: HypC/HybG/HupF family hydrogenase formation chaperone [Lentisphaerae bacterium]|nr:HypC/HybG/HupF family hydrogenase formation chaperone [Lentisphaerota bacterium]